MSASTPALIHLSKCNSINPKLLIEKQMNSKTSACHLWKGSRLARQGKSCRDNNRALNTRSTLTQSSKIWRQANPRSHLPTPLPALRWRRAVAVSLPIISLSKRRITAAPISISLSLTVVGMEAEGRYFISYLLYPKTSVAMVSLSALSCSRARWWSQVRKNRGSPAAWKVWISTAEPKQSWCSKLEDRWPH